MASYLKLENDIEISFFIDYHEAALRQDYDKIPLGDKTNSEEEQCNRFRGM